MSSPCWRLLGLAVSVALIAAVPTVASASNGEHRDVEATNVFNNEPAWSPDGRLIAFASSTRGGLKIMLIDVARRRVRPVSGAFGFVPTWIPSRNRLAYETQGAAGDSNLYVAGSGAREGTLKLVGIGRAAWSPDARKIVFDRRGPNASLTHWIYVMDSDGRHRRVVARDGNYDGAHPTWSPDGKEIAYVGGRNTDFATIRVVRADGGGERRVSHGGHEYFPAWSRDGKLIAFTSQGGLHDDYNHIGVVGADGSSEHLLTHGRWNDALPSWSPDGRSIAYGSDRTGNDEIWLMHRDGSDQRRLTYGGCTIVGTSGDDVLVGTPRRDVICGLGGNDSIYGRGGDDKLLGGSGDDRIFGGPGADTIFGQAGNDVLVGGQGRDVIDAGGGDDTVLAGDGAHDRIEGGPGRDRAVGDPEDFAYDTEAGNLPGHRHPQELSRAEISARTIAAVGRSHARLVSLVVRVPRDRYLLTVRVSDPAAYLLKRANTVVTVMNRVTVSRRVHFRRIRFAVQNARGRTVFSWSYTRRPGVTSVGARVDPRYKGCTGSLDLEQGEELVTPPHCRGR